MNTYVEIGTPMLIRFLHPETALAFVVYALAFAGVVFTIMGALVIWRNL